LRAWQVEVTMFRDIIAQAGIRSCKRLVWGFFLSRISARRPHVLISVLCSIAKPFPSSSTRVFAHVVARMICQVAVAHQPRGCSALARHTLDCSSTTATLVRSGLAIRGSSLSGADQSRHNLVSGWPGDPNHDVRPMRIGCEAPSAVPIRCPRIQPWHKPGPATS